jgi:taurine transport system permease protein
MFQILKTFLLQNKYKLISVISVLTVILLWELGSILNWFNPVFIPPISSVLSAFFEVLENGYKGYSLVYHVFCSMRRLFLAIGFAFLIAVPAGILAGSSRVFLAIIDPFVEFYRALPPLAYYTLLVLWFGIEDFSKVALLFLSGFAPLFIATVFAVQKVPKSRLNGAKSLGAKRISLFIKIIFPSCLPDILTGLRTAVGVSYATLVAAEMVAAVSGIGWMVLDASKYIRFDIVYFGIIIMGILAIIIDALLRILIHKITPWIGKE